MQNPSLATTQPIARNAIVYNPGMPLDAMMPPTSMLAFVRQLKQRHERVVEHLGERRDPRTGSFRENIRTLAFAEALLERAELIQQHPALPRQIAVIGPTQAGKSSLINWLLNREIASVSPLAGYTVHPQGFAIGVTTTQLEGLAPYFRGYQRQLRGELHPDRLDAYSLEELNTRVEDGPLEGAVFWDTPDFDSVDAAGYRDAVFRVAALADLIILMVSKDKYADLAVWELMSLLEPLNQPTLILLNKVDPAAEATLSHSIMTKWRRHRNDPPPTPLTLPYNPKDGLVGLETRRRELLDALQRLGGVDTRHPLPTACRRLIDQHWPAWIRPLQEEHRFQAEWESLVADTVDDCLARYQLDYLDHPLHYETFQRALAELLTLLEIPGIGGALLSARKAVTWPWRQLTRWGQSRTGRQRAEEGEAAILHQLAEHAFTRIHEQLLTDDGREAIKPSHGHSVSAALARQKPPLLNGFDIAARRYLENFQPEIERTAHGLYGHLQKHPLVLNGLRATRVTTDAAALAMAMHTGGIGIQDFVIAPAMLSVTTLLTESALGRYMNKAATQLKQRQKQAVDNLFRAFIEEPLRQLPSQFAGESRLNISADSLTAAENLRH